MSHRVKFPWGGVTAALLWSLPLAVAMCGEEALAQFAAAAKPTPAPTAPPVIPPITPPSNVPVVHLVDGGFLPGGLKAADDPKILRWQADAFTAPFDFTVNSVSSISFPEAAKLPRPNGEYQFELDGGDVLFGSLVRLTATEADLDLGINRQLTIKREQVLRIFRWRDNDATLYLGPNGLNEWNSSAIGSKWREEGGQLVADQQGTFVRRDFGLPAKACIEFELSWKNKADFLLALGVNNDDKVDQQAFRFEVWGHDLVVQRETDKEADVTLLQETKPGPGRVQLLAYLDQEQDRLQVFSVGGKLLADMKVASRKPNTYGGLRLANKTGDLRLERLRISRWNGDPPREVQSEKSRIHRDDGTIVYGQIKEYDAAAKQFVLLGDAGESRIDAAHIESVFLSLPKSSSPRTIRAVLRDRQRLSGELVRVTDGEVSLACPGMSAPLSFAIADLHSLVVVRHEFPPLAEPGRSGWLELSGSRSHGHLSNGTGRDDASCLVWQPRGSLTASALRPGVSGRVVYREVVPPAPSRPPEPQRQRGLIEQFFGAMASNPRTGAAVNLPSRFLHLRTGDTIPCEVVRIDESGVTIRTPLSDATLVSHEKIKAVELAEETRTIKVDKTKRERFLTLPRMQKENPPTHLIRSLNGDILRGRLIGLDEKELSAEVRLETKVIPRARVSRIIWLHDDELTTPVSTTTPADTVAPPVSPSPPLPPQPIAAPAKAAAAPPNTTRVQTLRTDGIRLTFFADRMTDGTLAGRSEVLGVCHVDLNHVDQLLFGDAIEQAAAKLVYHQWKLQNAPQPKFAQDETGGAPDSRNPGTESVLVGKPAPDFELVLLGGKKFHLSANKGQVVVLDFWATWCGPCLQAMPQLDRVIGEFKPEDVKLVAVNLQEPTSKSTSTLERLKLQTTVALDQDGVVADRYGATAIPMTVIVGRDGVVARVFIGGGPHFADQLRDALHTLLPDSAEDSATP